MKPTLTLLLLALLSLQACKKEENTGNTDQAPQTVNELVSRIVGTYNTTAYCYGGSGIDGYTYDTIPGQTTIVTAASDSSLMIDNRVLEFIGDLANKSYHFEDLHTPPSNGAHAFIDSNLTLFTYSHRNGGIGGGAGCSNTGAK